VAHPILGAVSVSAVVIITALAGVPVATLAHELGHAAAALRFTDRSVLILVGRAHPAVKGRAGRLLVRLSPLATGGRCLSWHTSSRRQTLIVTLAGPAASLAVALFLWLLGDIISGAGASVLFTLAALNALLALNLIPFRVVAGAKRGTPSDGLCALYLIRRRPIPPPRPSFTRAGFWNARELRQIGLIFGASAVVLGLFAALGEVVLFGALAVALHAAFAGGALASPGNPAGPVQAE
jgi:hypothetical protein